MKSYLASLNLDKTAPGLAVAKVFVCEIFKNFPKAKDGETFGKFSPFNISMIF